MAYFPMVTLETQQEYPEVSGASSTGQVGQQDAVYFLSHPQLHSLVAYIVILQFLWGMEVRGY